MEDDIVLIGPIGAGKSTIAKLLADALGRPQVSVDELRSVYFPELGYDHAHAEALQARSGIRAMCEYWKPFEAHQVERVLQDHTGCVFDFGAGHSVYEDPELLERVQTALEARFVVLLLPSKDPHRSAQVLKERFPAEVAQLDGLEELNEHYIRHTSNFSLATNVIYTDGKTAEDVRDEVLVLVDRKGHT